MTAPKTAPVPPHQQAIEKAKAYAKAGEKATEENKAATRPADQKLGTDPKETAGVEVKLPDPVAQDKKEAAKDLAELPEVPKIVNGEMQFSKNYMLLVRNQIAKDLTDDEFLMYGMMAKRFRLDPLARQITPVVFSADDPNKRRVSYVTTIDGLRLIAHRTGEFAGVDEPQFSYNGNVITHAAITVYKFVQNQRVGFSAKVKFTEYSTGKNLWHPQYGKPETMIAKVAEAHALRKAFPQELSGIYTSDEMEQSERNQAPVMASEQQRKMIMALLKQKGKTVEDLKAFMDKQFHIDSSKKLTSKMAATTINALQKLADYVEEVEVIDEPETEEVSFADFVDQENAAKGDIDLDELDAGIEAMRESK